MIPGKNARGEEEEERRNFYLKSNKMVNTTLANSLLRRGTTRSISIACKERSGDEKGRVTQMDIHIPLAILCSSGMPTQIFHSNLRETPFLSGGFFFFFTNRRLCVVLFRAHLRNSAQSQHGLRSGLT